MFGTPSLEKVPWHWWEALIVFLLAFVTSGVLSLIIASISRGDVGKATLIVVFEISLGFWALIWVHVRFDAGAKELGLRTENLWQNVGVGFLTGLTGLFLATVVVGQIVVRIVQALSDKAVKSPTQLDFASPGAAVLVVTGFGVIVAAPIAEELFFRGFMFQGFRRRFAMVPSALLSGALFGLAHAPFWLIVPSIATLGIVLAVVFERQRSLVATMVAHAVFNSIGFAAYIVSLHR